MELHVKLLQLWEDLRDISGSSGRKYYRLATITWSDPEVWNPSDRVFPVPIGWRGHGGIYAFTRKHWRQRDKMRIAYIGKALDFTKRLTSAHNHFNIVERRGDTAISCGRIAFDRVRSHPGYYIEIEDIVKFAVRDHLANKQGFESLPGFRPTSPIMMPWFIVNEGYSFGGIMPRRIAYPAIAVQYRIRQS